MDEFADSSCPMDAVAQIYKPWKRSWPVAAGWPLRLLEEEQMLNFYLGPREDKNAVDEKCFEEDHPVSSQDIPELEQVQNYWGKLPHVLALYM